MTDVLFRADDGPGIGAGHVMRCLALAEAVREQGGRVCLSAVSASPLHAGWQAIGARIAVAERPGGGTADRDMTLGLARDFAADWLVADGYAFDVPWLDGLADAMPLLYLDDLGERDAAAALVLNQNAGAQGRCGAAYRRCGRALLGPDWFLLRAAWRAVQPRPAAARLLVTLGGDDPDNRALAFMQALLADGREFSADVVCGAPPPGLAAARKLAAEHPGRFAVHAAPADLPALAASAAAAICGGGVTSLELASCGVPSVIVTLSADQAPGAQALCAAAAALPDDVNDISTSARAALDLLHDAALRGRMTQAGRDFVPSDGARRVLAAMEVAG